MSVSSTVSSTNTAPQGSAVPAPSDRSRVRRADERGHYDRETIHSIIDDAYVCHVAFADEHGVLCIPTACWREGDHVFIHGSNGSRMMKVLAQGAPACLTVTHLDGLVLARSAFHHSMNYRSVVVHGRFERVLDEDKPAVLDRLMDHIAPGRRHEVRPGDRNELAATTVLRIPLNDAAAKIRNWGPRDDEADMNLSVWAGVLPLTTLRGNPVPEPGNPDAAPDYVTQWSDGPSSGSRG